MAFSQSDSEGDLHEDNVIITPYDYQPKKKRKTLEPLENNFSGDDDNGNPSSPSNNSTDVSEWCKCGKCDTSLLVREKEFCCCKGRGEKLTRRVIRKETGKILNHYMIGI